MSLLTSNKIKVNQKQYENVISFIHFNESFLTFRKSDGSCDITRDIYRQNYYFWPVLFSPAPASPHPALPPGGPLPGRGRQSAGAAEEIMQTLINIYK